MLHGKNLVGVDPSVSSGGGGRALTTLRRIEGSTRVAVGLSPVRSRGAV